MFRRISLSMVKSNLCTTATLGKWQGDRYIQVNFAENIRQLKILGIYGVTTIHRAVIYKLIVSGILKVLNSPNNENRKSQGRNKLLKKEKMENQNITWSGL